MPDDDDDKNDEDSDDEEKEKKSKKKNAKKKDAKNNSGSSDPDGKKEGLTVVSSSMSDQEEINKSITLLIKEKQPKEAVIALKSQLEAKHGKFWHVFISTRGMFYCTTYDDNAKFFCKYQKSDGTTLWVLAYRKTSSSIVA